MKRILCCAALLALCRPLFAAEFGEKFGRGRDWARTTGATDTIRGGLQIDGSLAVGGSITATSYAGDGSALTGIGSSLPLPGGASNYLPRVSTGMLYVITGSTFMIENASVTIRGDSSALRIEGTTTSIGGIAHNWMRNAGTNGQVIESDGSGNLVWATDDTGAGADTVVQSDTIIIGTAASQNPNYIGTDEKVFIAVSTTLALRGGGKIKAREGTYTLTAGVTVHWNQQIEGMGKATNFTTNGNFNAFWVSGTVTNVNVTPPANYANHFFIMQTSSVLDGMTSFSGSLQTGAFPFSSIIRIGTEGGVIPFTGVPRNVRVRNIDISNIGSNGTGSGVNIISISTSIDVQISDWRIANCFAGQYGAAAIAMNSPQYFQLKDGYFEGASRFLAYDGASSHTVVKGNFLRDLSSTEGGWIANVEMGAAGNASDFNFEYNTLEGRNGQEIQYNAPADGLIEGGRTSFNTFLGSVSNMIIIGNANFEGMVFHGNVFGSSSTISDSGLRTVFRDNFLMQSGTLYPNDTDD